MFQMVGGEPGFRTLTAGCSAVVCSFAGEF